MSKAISGNPGKHIYKLLIYNGRVKVYIDDYVMLSFNLQDFKAYYSSKEDNSLFSIKIYLICQKGGGSHTIDVQFEQEKVWLNVLKLLDKHL